MMRISRDRSRQIFGHPAPPKTVWEQQFDGDQAALEALAFKLWPDITGTDLNCYLYDLTWVSELQPDLFRYLFPACLNFWYDSLMQSQPAGSFGFTDLHQSLETGNILQRMLTEDERNAVYDFFHDGLIDRIEAERGFIYTGSGTPAYEWMSRFRKLGYLAPITERIWTTWWRLDHPGKAVAAMMYASALIYLKGETPIFAAWTPDHGGGGPYIMGGTPWLEANYQFMERTLSVAYVQAKMVQAADCLHGEPEAAIAAQVAADAAERAEILELRIDDLVQSLWSGVAVTEDW